MREMKLTTEEQKLLDRETKKKKEEILANRVPEEAMKDMNKVLAIIDIPEFKERKWFYGHYEDGFITLHGYRFGKDTDGKECHAVFYFNFDITNDYTSVNIDCDLLNSKGLLANLLSNVNADYSGYPGIDDDTIDKAETLKSLQVKANEFISARIALEEKYDDDQFCGTLIDMLDRRMEELLGNPQKPDVVNLKDVMWDA